LLQLEAFRKQKSEGKAKKSAPPSPSLPTSAAKATSDGLYQAPTHLDAPTTLSTSPPISSPLPPIPSSALSAPVLPPPAPDGVHAGGTPPKDLGSHLANGSHATLTSGGALPEGPRCGQRNGGAPALGGVDQEEEPPPLPVSRPPKAAESPPGSISKVIRDGGGWALVVDCRLAVSAGERRLFLKRWVVCFHNAILG
jgi:hypothetical protein